MNDPPVTINVFKQEKPGCESEFESVLSDLIAAEGDCTNPLVANKLHDMAELKTSGGEQIAAWLPQARVVKIFNTIGWETMAQPQYGSETATMFYAGDHPEAKAIAAQLAHEIGFFVDRCGRIVILSLSGKSSRVLGATRVWARYGTRYWVAIAEAITHWFSAGCPRKRIPVFKQGELS